MRIDAIAINMKLACALYMYGNLCNQLHISFVCICGCTRIHAKKVLSGLFMIWSYLNVMLANKLFFDSLEIHGSFHQCWNILPTFVEQCLTFLTMGKIQVTAIQWKKEMEKVLSNKYLRQFSLCSDIAFNNGLLSLQVYAYYTRCKSTNTHILPVNDGVFQFILFDSNCSQNFSIRTNVICISMFHLLTFNKILYQPLILKVVN